MHQTIMAVLISGALGFTAPCAKVSASWAAQATSAFTRDHRAQVLAQDAFDCLKSVPIDNQGDLREIEELKEFIQYQTTLRFLQNGRHVNDEFEIHNERLNIEERLEDMSNSIRNGTYQDDFSVQLDIHTLFRLSGDFHLRFRPDLLEIFLFVRPESQIVSISTDGVFLPQLYFLSDLKHSQSPPDFTPSPLKTINDLEATDYLEKLWTHGVYHDADARYNSFFPNPAAATLDMDSGGQFYLTRSLYDGPRTEFSFANGSSLIKENMALIREFFDFSGVTDGPSFFARFCQGKPQITTTFESLRPSTTTRTYSSCASTSKPSPTGYPQPISAQSGLSVLGYHLNSSIHRDVAVLALPNLHPFTNGSTIMGFLEAQNMLRNFIRLSKQENRIKLIIDLRGNSGGTIDMAFELFKQLFPQVEPFGASRYRAHEAFWLHSSSVAELAQNNSAAANDAEFAAGIIGSTANFANLLNLRGAPFPDFRTYYGPYGVSDDIFTATQRYDFSNHFGGHTLAPHVNISGYGSSQNTVQQPFESDNMVLLQDGLCGSACAMFSHMMREQGNVKTIAIGGRPRSEPMQGVGGTRGAQLLKFDSVIRHMETTAHIFSLLHGPAAVKKLLEETAVGRILNASQIRVRSAHFNSDEIVNGAVNSLDNLRQADVNGSPLEFVYQAADCRLFYTKESFFSPLSLWEMAASAKWGDLKCVNGSEGHATALSVVLGTPFNARGSLMYIGGLHILSGVLLVLTVLIVLFRYPIRSQGWTRVARDAA